MEIRTPEPRLILANFWRPSAAVASRNEPIPCRWRDASYKYSLKAADVAPFLSCLEAWTIFGENYQQMKTCGVKGNNFPWWIDFRRDQLSLCLLNGELHHATNDLDLSKIKRLILSPFYGDQWDDDDLKPVESPSDRLVFDFCLTSALKCFPNLRNLTFNHSGSHPTGSRKVYAMPIGEDFESKVFFHPKFHRPNLLHIIGTRRKNMHLWFEDAIKKHPRSRQNLKFYVCAFAEEVPLKETKKSKLWEYWERLHRKKNTAGPSGEFSRVRYLLHHQAFSVDPNLL